VVALEIDDRNFEMPQRNVDPYPSILPRKIGLWSKPTKLTVANPNDACWSFRAMESDNPNAPGIDAVGVRELAAEFGTIDLLKMDIEGGEFEVLSEHPEAWLNEVRTMAVETARSVSTRQSGSTRTCPHGVHIRAIRTGRVCHSPQSAIVACDGVTVLIRFPCIIDRIAGRLKRLLIHRNRISI